jgi:site-specific recombinase XerD
VTPLAPHLTAYLRERLPLQKGASEQTCETYAYAFQLLLTFASTRCKVSPSRLMLEHLDSPLILAFLEHLESKRGNSARTRNARLAAIRSFMHFIEYRVPSAIEQVRRILSIPAKRTTIPVVPHLSTVEMRALLDAPDLSTRAGIRDRAMLHLCFAAGLRASELVTLPLAAVSLHPRPTVRVMGKGRRERVLPLWKETVADLRAWLRVRGDAPGVPELFTNARGQPMTRAGLAYVLRSHARTAAAGQPTMSRKRISPHVLRHTCALTILQATGDLRKVSLWLGHADMQTTMVYLRADPTEKIATVSAVAPMPSGRFRLRAPDKLLASLHRR